MKISLFFFKKNIEIDIDTNKCFRKKLDITIKRICNEIYIMIMIFSKLICWKLEQEQLNCEITTDCNHLVAKIVGVKQFNGAKLVELMLIGYHRCTSSVYEGCLL